ncbi:T9SS type A sorting domain-containing protein [Calditrichota bacterium]
MRIKYAALFSLNFIIVIMLTVSVCHAQPQYNQHDIQGNIEGIEAIAVADMNDDGDIDIVAVTVSDNDCGIYIWSNDGENQFTPVQINGNDLPCYDLALADIDEDGLMDIVIAAYDENRDANCKVSWWENRGDMNFLEHNVMTDYAAGAVCTADIDGDDDIDIFGGPYAGGDDIYTWENSNLGAFTTHRLTYDDELAHAVTAIDLDEDGDCDLLAAVPNYSDIRWWSNDGEGTFTRHFISDHFNDAKDLFVIDMDGDDDLDVLGAAAYRADIVVWWENNGAETFTDHLIATRFEGAKSVYAADLDLDGDIDVLGAAPIDDEITWWENGGDGDFTEHNLTDQFDGATDVIAVDLDSDFDIDIVAASRGGGLQWWENDYTPTPPGPFRLVSPENGAVFNSFPVALTWTTAVDPDPLDIVSYEIWVDDSLNMVNPQLVGTTQDTAFTLQELYREGEIYWAVKATDPLMPGTWAGDTLYFRVFGPDPPRPFSLLNPRNGDTLEMDISNLTDFIWQRSIDPDSGENVNYNLRILFTFAGDRQTFLTYTQLISETLTVNIPDSLMIPRTVDYIDVSWRVLALSGRDIVECNNVFDFAIAPYADVPESEQGIIPDKFTIQSIYPNPFNPRVNIDINLPLASNLEVAVYNVLGRQVANLAHGFYQAGIVKLTFDGEDLPGGIYLVNASVPGKMNEIRKVVLLK